MPGNIFNEGMRPLAFAGVICYTLFQPEGTKIIRMGAGGPHHASIIGIAAQCHDADGWYHQGQPETWLRPV